MQCTVDVHLGRSFINRSDRPVPDLHEKGVDKGERAGAFQSADKKRPDYGSDYQHRAYPASPGCLPVPHASSGGLRFPGSGSR